MTFSDWLLFLHIASAFALVTALVVYWTIAIAARNVERPVDSVRYFRVAKPANVLIVVGTLGTLIFGIWLAIERDEYLVWDGWVLAALVLWAVASETGRRGGLPYLEAKKLAERLAAEGRADEPSPELHAKLKDRNAMMLQALSSLAVLFLLLDMIFKPGA